MAQKVATEPLLETLWNAGQLASESFAIQFCAPPDVASGGTRSGWLTLGGYLSSQVAADEGGGVGITWLPNRKATGSSDHSYWLVGAQSVTVGSDTLAFDAAALGGVRLAQKTNTL